MRLKELIPILENKKVTVFYKSKEWSKMIEVETNNLLTKFGNAKIKYVKACMSAGQDNNFKEKFVIRIE